MDRKEFQVGGKPVNGYVMSVPKSHRGQSRWSSDRQHYIPRNQEIVDWLDHSTPGWSMVYDADLRTMRLWFASKEHAALYRLFYEFE